MAKCYPRDGSVGVTISGNRLSLAMSSRQYDQVTCIARRKINELFEGRYEQRRADEKAAVLLLLTLPNEISTQGDTNARS
jgi:hypothetical protein